jgi:cysteine dioxygenase
MSLSIDNFFHQLDQHPESVPLGELVDLMKQLEVQLEDLGDCVQFSEECYQRNLWRCGHGYAALLLCWSPGQVTPIHDHKGSACGVLVLQGEVTEEVFLKNDDGTLRSHITNTYQPGFVCGSNDTDMHTLANRQPEGHNMVTLHIYTPPLQGYRVYQMDGTFEICADSTLQQQKEMLGQTT